MSAHNRPSREHDEAGADAAPRLLLASGSPARAAMLRAAGLDFAVMRPGVDEAALRAALGAEGAAPRDVADALAEAKARRASARRPGALAIGSDQVLALGGEILSKPESPEAALETLGRLSGRTHALISAAVACEGGAPVWRHVETVRVEMRAPSAGYLADYVARNWAAIRETPGAYLIEGEGARLIARIEGSHYAALGLPLLPLLGWLAARGEIAA